MPILSQLFSTVIACSFSHRAKDLLQYLKYDGARRLALSYNNPAVCEVGKQDYSFMQSK